MSDRPGFFETLISGAVGMAKGAMILGGIGLAVGGLLSLALGGAAAVVSGALGFAMMGAVAGGLIGAFTGVAQTREAQASDPQDIINLANISFSQGVSVGRSKELSKERAEELEQSASHFREKIAAAPKAEPLVTR